jgi:hypothetical protein
VPVSVLVTRRDDAEKLALSRSRNTITGALAGALLVIAVFTQQLNVAKIVVSKVINILVNNSGS